MTPEERLATLEGEVCEAKDRMIAMFPLISARTVKYILYEGCKIGISAMQRIVNEPRDV